jgi:RluA family pseudouridine synthase
MNPERCDPQVEITLRLELDRLKDELIQLKTLAIYQAYEQLKQRCDRELKTLDQLQQEQKCDRDRQRKLDLTEQQYEALNQQSRQASTDRRRLKQQHREYLEPLRQEILAAETRINEIYQERRHLSQQLQKQLEITGALLSQTQNRSLDLTILYEDEHLLAIDKPSGLLSVPGRGSDRLDSVWLRLRSRYPEVTVVHRLDQDTSGVLLLAKSGAIHRALQQAFEGRQVEKVYEAVVVGTVGESTGSIALPLWGDPTQRPCQIVDAVRGKVALTHFEVLERSATQTRLAFYPVTGRTHQLRVHAAIGLGCAIVGDRLYGTAIEGQRLLLHARQLTVLHPIDGQPLCITSSVPF